SLTTDGDHVLLRVHDDGPGIPPEHHERVFERFARLDEARSRNGGGAGLGLAIVREIVQAHHGTVEVITANGGCFLMTLPLSD
ncbi:MAG: ATP-binding protein, partial [Actinomycetota bacterium]|nr:ATP-binding protein [Actinomycetota bacterium]